MVTCFIGIGSNLGDRQYYIETAISMIRLLTQTRVNQVSKIRETLPEGNLAQGRYLNCVIEIQTTLSPYELLRRLQKIEADLGRVRSIKNEPRNIDLDILLYGNIRIKENSLCIPHPRMLKREFVMQPLGEIAPQVVKKLKSKISLQKQKNLKRKKRR
ncbi:MAG: 2-amino-4-hydroxy-6-hydroxymethyldihydropteridine diphosphokinase [Candidatus Omnitrophota bacterium]|jgi:2-amino-4-hydroxy-6-hydroxymethyldihydropteridine diphosphokinase